MNRLLEKIDDLRWHVAKGHRNFAVRELKLHDPLRIPRDFTPPLSWHLPEQGLQGDKVWVITCCGNTEFIENPSMEWGWENHEQCAFERAISETEIALAGRLELADRYGIGELIESVKREVRREIPKAWSKVGELAIGEDD